MKLSKLMQLTKKEIFKPENAIKILTETEKEIIKINKKNVDIIFWHNFLDITSNSDFLQALETDKNRTRWAEVVFKIIQITDYRFIDLFNQRVAEYPDKTLFQVKSGNRNVKWSYRQISAHIKEIGAFIHKLKPEKPRVAIFMRNELYGDFDRV